MIHPLRSIGMRRGDLRTSFVDWKTFGDCHTGLSLSVRLRMRSAMLREAGVHERRRGTAES